MEWSNVGLMLGRRRRYRPIASRTGGNVGVNQAKSAFSSSHYIGKDGPTVDLAETIDLDLDSD